VKARTLKKDKVNIITMGCSKNLVDSEVLLTQLKGNGIEAFHESKSKDNNIVIINTCGFIDNAKQESIDTSCSMSMRRKSAFHGLVDKVYVTGCLSQRYKDDLEKEIPQVDAYFGTRDLPALLKKFKADYKHELVGERLLTHIRPLCLYENFRRL
jgi:ribosomal protein S12 methylthiotransferase